MDHPVVLVSGNDPSFVAALGKQATLAGLWVVPDLSSEVCEIARELRPEVVVLDVKQKMDGRQLLAELRAAPEIHDSKVIVSSEHPDEQVREDYLRLGATEYVVKPLDTQFITRLAKLAGDVRRERMLSTRG